jgi:hypothetical protein
MSSTWTFGRIGLRPEGMTGTRSTSTSPKGGGTRYYWIRTGTQNCSGTGQVLLGTAHIPQVSLVEAGRVFLPEAAPWLEALVHALSTFPAGAHVDFIDSTSQVLNYLRVRSIPAFGFEAVNASWRSRFDEDEDDDDRPRGRFGRRGIWG